MSTQPDPTPTTGAGSDGPREADCPRCGQHRPNGCLCHAPFPHGAPHRRLLGDRCVCAVDETAVDRVAQTLPHIADKMLSAHVKDEDLRAVIDGWAGALHGAAALLAAHPAEEER